MGLVRKPSIKDYWHKRFGSTNTPWFRKMFSRNRFQLIYCFFHLVNNRVTQQRNSDFYDPAVWFKPIMQHANNVFKRYISPNRKLSVDEALVGTKARSVMTRYIPTKSHKFGIKLWVLVEAVSDYIIHFFPYRGRPSTKRRNARYPRGIEIIKRIRFAREVAPFVTTFSHLLS